MSRVSSDAHRPPYINLFTCIGLYLISLFFSYLLQQPPKILRMHTIGRFFVVGSFTCMWQTNNGVTPSTWRRLDNPVTSDREIGASIWTLADHCANTIGPLGGGKNNWSRYPCLYLWDKLIFSLPSSKPSALCSCRLASMFPASNKLLLSKTLL